MRRWLKGEPKLRDVLADPVIQLMMRRDRVDPDDLHALLRNLKDARVRADFGGMPAVWADFECAKGEALAR